MSLSWNVPASDGGSAITNYKVYRGTTSGAYTSSGLVGSAATSFTVTGLTNGTTYYFAVAAINSVGEGSKSSEISKTSTNPCTPGSQPFNYTGDDQNFTVPAGCTQITVKAWGAGGGGTNCGVGLLGGGAGGYASSTLSVTP